MSQRKNKTTMTASQIREILEAEKLAFNQKKGKGSVLDQFEQEYAAFYQYLLPLQGDSFLQHQMLKNKYSVSIDNIFEIVYSLLGQLILV